MSKNLPPPLNMKVQRGALVPSTPYDAERLDSYRVGSTVHVLFTADRMRPLERKYRAILSKVIKDCKTPWSNAEAAHQALKLACGYVNVGKTPSGQFMQWPRSLADLDDQEMSDYFDDAMALLSRMTGVDVATLRKETAHVDEERFDRETGEIIETPSTESGSPPQEPGTAESEPSPASAASDDAPPTPSSDASHYEWLLNITKMLWGATNPGGELSVLVNQKKAALASYPTPTDLPNLVRGKAEAVYGYAKQIITRDIDQQDGLALIAGVVGVDQDNIGRVA